MSDESNNEEEKQNEEAGEESTSDESSEAEGDEGVPVEVDTAKYLITGLVDFTDEQGNIRGQLPIGSEQELPIEVGDKAVELGNATKVE